MRRIKTHGIVPLQIVDIGAAKGLWTRECLEVFPDANYFLIDPLEENIAALEKLQQNKSNINLWIGALGPKPETLNLYVHEDQSSFFQSEYSKSNQSSTRTIEVRTLDSFTEDDTIQPPDMIKADVQGFELEVLKGAEKCLENTQLLLLEVSYRKIYENSPLIHDVISFVASKGFRVFDVCSYIQRPLDNELAQSDILFVKNNSPIFSNQGWAI